MTATRPTERGNGRNEIVAAAQRLIARRGMSSFSVRELMREAHLSSTGSYSQHFRNSGELLAAALDKHVDDIDKVFAIALLGARNSPETAMETLRMAVLQIIGDRTRALVAAELRLYATRDAGGRALQERSDALMSSVLTPLHELTEQPITTVAVQEALDRLLAIAVRHASRHDSRAEFRRAVRRTLFATYGGF